MNSFEHPISNTQFPTEEGLEQTWTLDISRSRGIPPCGTHYWIFGSKFLNLTAMTITLLTKIPVPASRISLFFDFLEKLFGQAILMHSLITSSRVDNL